MTKKKLLVSTNGATIVKRPEFLNNLPHRGEKAQEIHSIHLKLKDMAGDESVCYDLRYFERKLDIPADDREKLESNFSYIKNVLRTKYEHGRIKIHFHLANKKIYIWEVKV